MSYWDETYSIGSRVINNVISLYDARWCGDHFVIYRNIKSLCFTPELTQVYWSILF